jgi:hypothetical protein
MNLAERIDEINHRLFALEGRMTTYETLANEDREYRKEIHKRLIEGQDKLDERMRKMEIKIACWGGGVTVLGLILKFLVK